MAIDSRVPLAGQGVELGRSAASGAIAGNALLTMAEERRNAPLVREALQTKLESGKLALSQEKAMEQLRRASFDAQGLRASLARGDLARTRAQLVQRRADIIARDGANADTSHTDAWIAQIDSGDPAQIDAFANELNDIDATAIKFGAIPAPSAPAGYANIKTDAQGRVWGTNPQTGAFEQIPTAQGANFTKPQAPAQAQLPASAIQLFQQWASLNPQATPEQQRAAFDNIVRAPQIVAMGGGGQAAYTPLSGTSEPVVTPEDASARAAATAAAVKGAEATASAEADKEAQAVKNQKLWIAYKTARDNYQKALAATATVPFGDGAKLTAAQQNAARARAQFGLALKRVTRDAGEGTFAKDDREAMMLGVPDIGDYSSAREAALESIDATVAAGLGIDLGAPQVGGQTGSGGAQVGSIVEVGGKRYRIVGGDPNDPDVEEVK